MSFEAESPKKVCLCGDNKTYITNFRRLVKHNVSLLDLNFELSKYPSVWRWITNQSVQTNSLIWDRLLSSHAH